MPLFIEYEIKTYQVCCFRFSYGSTTVSILEFVSFFVVVVGTLDILFGTEELVHISFWSFQQIMCIPCWNSGILSHSFVWPILDYTHNLSPSCALWFWIFQPVMRIVSLKHTTSHVYSTLELSANRHAFNFQTLSWMTDIAFWSSPPNLFLVVF